LTGDCVDRLAGPHPDAVLAGRLASANKTSQPHVEPLAKGNLGQHLP
jgi:hypothetical protein